MGLPMCGRLLDAGYRLVVHNRTPQKAAPLAARGAIVADSPASLAARCDVVIACLDTVGASEIVFLGARGVVANAREGALLIDHGTIMPDLAIRVARAAGDRGLAYLDAPVSGGPEGAANGTLAIMAGGSAAAFERALPVLHAYGGAVSHLGPTPNGTHAKLVNQLLTFVHGAAAAEAIALAQRSGLDLTALADVLRSSFGHSRMLDRTLARVQSGDYKAGAALSLYDKDLAIVVKTGEEFGLTLPVTDAARVILADALGAGLAARDIAALRLRYPDSGASEKG
jgi:3-hydroxyisobutyrate dehydrogenase